MEENGGGQAEMDKQRIARIEGQMAILRDENFHLQHDLEAAKKKKLDPQGRPPRLGPHANNFSIPHPPDGGGPLPFRPVGRWSPDQPLHFINVKPILMKVSRTFKGKHDDIERFLGDCMQYFETFKYHYQGIHSLMVGLTVSLLKEDAEEWWVHERDQYWHVPTDPGLDGTPEEDADFEVGPWYHYPRWDDFMELFREQFRDPAIELIHEKWMGEMKMGSDPAHVFFQKLEREAKLANRLADHTDRELLVQAVRRGIPLGYGTAITNLGITIPHTYAKWKE